MAIADDDVVLLLDALRSDIATLQSTVTEMHEAMGLLVTALTPKPVLPEKPLPKVATYGEMYGDILPEPAPAWRRPLPLPWTNSLFARWFRR